MITNHKQTNKYNKIKLKKNNYNSNILNKDYETTLITLLQSMDDEIIKHIIQNKNEMRKFYYRYI